jgi:hypothetical protein
VVAIPVLFESCGCIVEIVSRLIVLLDRDFLCRGGKTSELVRESLHFEAPGCDL